jgi:hypothetical protein
MTKLTDREVIALLHEEYQKKVQEVVDELDAFIKLGSLGKVNILSPGLKIRERESGLLYTIDVVRPDGCTVKSPVGDESFISNKELRARYALD